MTPLSLHKSAICAARLAGLRLEHRGARQVQFSCTRMGLALLAEDYKLDGVSVTDDVIWSTRRDL